MAKPDPALLDPARYPYMVEIATRHADLDTNNHINNVALSAMVEDARVRFYIHSGFFKMLPKGGQLMVVNVTIDYLAQAFYPEAVMVYSGMVPGVGRSWRMRHLLIQGGRAVALAETVGAHVVEGRATRLPEELIALMAPWNFL